MKGMRDQGVGLAKGTFVAVLALAIVLMAVPWVVRPASAGVIDPNVVLFEPTKPFINLNRTTDIKVEIGTSYGAGMDNYMATVTAPGGPSWSLWYNFTAVGSMVKTFGNVSKDFMARVTKVGTYDVRLEYYNGVTFSLAGLTEFKTTDKLNVVFLIRSASNPATNQHSCPVASEFVRGGKFIGGAYVTYASTGEDVTTQNSNAAGNITGAILGMTNVMVGPPIWHSAWYFPWNAPVGQVKFYVNASDGMGNTGRAVTGEAGNRAVTIVPDTLQVKARIMNATGAESVTFAPGDTMSFEVEARYDDHAAVNPAYVAPLNATRGGQVKVHVGWGSFNASSGVFANTLTNVTLTLDVASQVWKGQYTIPTGTANLTGVQAVVTASDGATPPNVGTTMTTQFTVRKPPAPEIVEVPVTVEKSTGFEMPVVAGLSIVLLLAGLGVGMVMSRRRRGNDKPSAAEPEEDMTDEWEEQ